LTAQPFEDKSNLLSLPVGQYEKGGPEGKGFGLRVRLAFDLQNLKRSEVAMVRSLLRSARQRRRSSWLLKKAANAIIEPLEQRTLLSVMANATDYGATISSIDTTAHQNDDHVSVTVSNLPFHDWVGHPEGIGSFSDNGFAFVVSVGGGSGTNARSSFTATGNHGGGSYGGYGDTINHPDQPLAWYGEFPDESRSITFDVTVNGLAVGEYWTAGFAGINIRVPGTR